MNKKLITILVVGMIAVIGVAYAAEVADWSVGGGTAKLVESGGAITLTVDSIAGVSGAITSTSSADGSSIRLISRASIGSDDWAVGTNSLGITIPDNAVVVGGYLDVTTAFLDASTNTATFGLQLNGSSDIKAQATNATEYAAGIHALTPVNTAATSVKMTAARVLSFVVVGMPATSGVATAVIEYDLLAR